MKQYVQSMDQITESPSIQVDNGIIWGNNQGTATAYDRLNNLQ